MSASKRPAKSQARSVAALLAVDRGATRLTAAVTPTSDDFWHRPPAADRPRLVVFVGAGDVDRASVAVTWFAALASAAKARAVFAATAAAPTLSPAVVDAMKEVGLDLAGARARRLTPELVAAADLVITLAGTRGRTGVKLPGHPTRREHWAIPNGSDDGARARARSLRDTVRGRIAMLAFMEGWGRPEISREAARITRPRPLDIDGHPL